MILDSSAVLAILFQEPEAPLFAATMERALVCRLSAASHVELSIVVEAQEGAAGLQDLEQFIREAKIVVESFTLEQAYISQRAWTTYGRGKHPARLNFGDCFSYALAKALDEPLLFKGNDFARTDIQSAL
ncbi:MAG: type II toxin-antitoxin system VapC family toxin [Acidobacteria bacterium]|nr:type II toxin-antitoxin system VapC family toxin [Acidobacteriota bacterium]MBS1866698.1 type II toxin-antitoxin system VapC family toxin [Acidobacteriota bacterium]